MPALTSSSVEWWNVAPGQLTEIGFDNPEAFCDCLDESRRSDALIPYAPFATHLRPDDVQDNGIVDDIEIGT